MIALGLSMYCLVICLMASRVSAAMSTVWVWKQKFTINILSSNSILLSKFDITDFYTSTWPQLSSESLGVSWYLWTIISWGDTPLVLLRLDPEYPSGYSDHVRGDRHRQDYSRRWRPAGPRAPCAAGRARALTWRSRPWRQSVHHAHWCACASLLPCANKHADTCEPC